MIMQITIHLLTILTWPLRSYNVSVKEVGEFPTMLHSFLIRTSKFGPEAQAILIFFFAFWVENLFSIGS